MSSYGVTTLQLYDVQTLRCLAFRDDRGGGSGASRGRAVLDKGSKAQGRVGPGPCSAHPSAARTPSLATAASQPGRGPRPSARSYLRTVETGRSNSAAAGPGDLGRPGGSYDLGGIPATVDAGSSPDPVPGPDDVEASGGPYGFFFFLTR